MCVCIYPRVVEKFRKNVSCFYAQERNVGMWSLK